MWDNVRWMTWYICPEEQERVLWSKDYYKVFFPRLDRTYNVHHQYFECFEYRDLPNLCEVVDKNWLVYNVRNDLYDKVECTKKGKPNDGFYVLNKRDILIVNDLFDHEEYDFQSLTITKPMSKLKQIMAESYMDAAKTNEVILLAKELKGRIDSLRKTKEEIDSHLENSESILERIEEEFENPEKEVMEPMLTEARTMLSNSISISY